MIGTYLYQAGISIPFTPNAVIIAQVFVALPFFVATAVTTLQAIPREYEEIALVEGAKPAEITFKVLLPLAAPYSPLPSCSPSPAPSANTAQPSPSPAMCKAKPKPYPSPST